MDVAVWAPHADAVAVRATIDTVVAPSTDRRDDEAERSALRDHPLDRRDDGWWSADVPMQPGDAYRLVVRRGDDEVERIDPLAREVTSSVGHSIARPIEPFDRGDFVAPPRHEWVLYELHPGTFGGGLDGVVERLDHLSGLGVNAIELMPVASSRATCRGGTTRRCRSPSSRRTAGRRRFDGLVDGCHAARHRRDRRRGLQPPRPERSRPVALRRLVARTTAAASTSTTTSAPRRRGATPGPTTAGARSATTSSDNARMWLAEYGVDGLRLDSTRQHPQHRRDGRRVARPPGRPGVPAVS